MNRLADSHSPYLLQHKDNPVDWYPWGDQAFADAADRGVPVFLSIGYAACHWCHVMAHESFEDETIAKLMNDQFVNIKVDREERPDIDSIYMNAVQIMTGRGGWPMSVFMDHDRKPFYAGTYWPPISRMQMPGFPDVLRSISAAWTDRRDEVSQHAEQITDAIRSLSASDPDQAETMPERSDLQSATDRLVQSADMIDGGFGAAPKFPHATDLMWLIRCLHRASVDGQTTSESKIHITDQTATVVRTTLDSMAAGGIRDHIGGGFSRYSVDAKWLVPHFEKMLYDNALLAKTYTQSYCQSHHDADRDIATETLDYVVTELTDASGGFHCSEDADSEGEEGKFYVWSPEEIIEVLGEERGKRFCVIYDVTDAGNFEGRSILNLKRPLDHWVDQSGDPALLEELQHDRTALLKHRRDRIRPGRDDKIIVAWNALAIDALALAGGAFDRADYITAAADAARFIGESMTDDAGRLQHAFRRGHSHIDAMADDYAAMILALTSLYRSTAEIAWIESAKQYADQLIEHFEDKDAGGFFYTRDDGPPLLTREKEWHDSSLISSNALAASGLWILGTLTTETRYSDAARRTIIAGGEVIKKQSMAAGGLLIAADQIATQNVQHVYAVPDQQTFQRCRGQWILSQHPDAILAWNVGDEPTTPLANDKTAIDAQPTLYRCENFRCQAPVQINVSSGASGQ